MLQGCGGCSVQQAIPILLNPVTWLVAISAVTALLSKKSGSKK